MDDVVERATTLGAALLRPVENRFDGDRGGQIRDPFGHLWNVATHVDDVSVEEMRRHAAAFASAPRGAEPPRRSPA